MYKKFLTFFLCIILGVSLVSCSGPKKEEPAKNKEQQEITDNTNNTDNSEQEEEPDSLKPILGEDATDEELLDVLEDDTNVVSNEDFSKTVAEMRENTEKFSGQIYQMEGIYTQKGDDPYITNTPAEGDEQAAESLPLRYLSQELKEGDRIKVTGIVNQGEIAGETVVTLDIVVLESLE